MRRLLCCQLAVSLLLAGMAPAAQVPTSSQTGPPSENSAEASPTSVNAGGVATTTRPTLTPGVTISGKAPHHEPPLPKLPPDESIKCLERGGFGNNPFQAAFCATQIGWEKHMVLWDCLDTDGKLALPRVIQACTESLDREILPYKERFLLFESRGDAYLALGYERRALEDYNEGVKVAPDSASVYYNRGAFYVAKSDYAAALRDFDTALGIDSRLVPALLQRAKIYAARNNFGGALADYSGAIRLQPKTAALWSDRGHVDLRQHDYESAVKDEARAIQLDPKLARAYYLRSVAFGALGDRANAVSDLQTAVRLDPSLARYVMIKGKTVSLELPPL